jgi:hypothetical protein
VAYVQQGSLGPTVPTFWTSNPAYAQVQNEHVWAAAWADIIASGMTPQAAAEKLPLPDKPSIAVLPFANMSSDPEQGYFADGMVDEIITALSRIRWLFVIARREVMALVGFTRFEPAGTDEKGELDLDGIAPAAVSPEPEWFPAIENRGEGVFVVLSTQAITGWRESDGVRRRGTQFLAGKVAWDQSTLARTATCSVCRT